VVILTIKKKQFLRCFDAPGMQVQWEKNIKIEKMLCQKRLKTMKYQQVLKKE
jgi:hypothetical protein